MPWQSVFSDSELETFSNMATAPPKSCSVVTHASEHRGGCQVLIMVAAEVKPLASIYRLKEAFHFGLMQRFADLHFEVDLEGSGVVVLQTTYPGQGLMTFDACPENNFPMRLESFHWLLNCIHHPNFRDQVDAWMVEQQRDPLQVVKSPWVGQWQSIDLVNKMTPKTFLLDTLMVDRLAIQLDLVPQPPVASGDESNSSSSSSSCKKSPFQASLAYVSPLIGGDNKKRDIFRLDLDLDVLIAATKPYYQIMWGPGSVAAAAAASGGQPQHPPHHAPQTSSKPRQEQQKPRQEHPKPPPPLHQQQQRQLMTTEAESLLHDLEAMLDATQPLPLSVATPSAAQTKTPTTTTTTTTHSPFEFPPGLLRHSDIVITKTNGKRPAANSKPVLSVSSSAANKKTKLSR